MLYFLLVTLPLAVADLNKTVCYLQRFGYMDDIDLTGDITNSILTLQETYGLVADGQLNNEILDFIEKPRCGNKDELLTFTADRSRKWFSNDITWNAHTRDRGILNLAETAFNVWAKHANVSFRRSVARPMIYISSGEKQHYNFARRGNCTDFDGKGGTIAHAYSPMTGTDMVDIHFDRDEKWAFTMDLPRGDEISYYVTLVHEIGHALGIGHSYVNTSIMYPLYQIPEGLSSLHDYDLNGDDINAIQFLYGSKQVAFTPSTTTLKPSTSTFHPSTTTFSPSTTTFSPSTTTFSPSTTTFSPSTTTFKPLTPTKTVTRDICTYRNDIDTYLIVDRHIYAFYNEYVWIVTLDIARRKREQYTQPKIITQWLTFLPVNFTRISAVYQRPNDEVVLFVGESVYSISYPALTLLRRDSVRSVLQRDIKGGINAVINTNRGRTYVLFDEWVVGEILECSFRTVISGPSYNVFEGVPSGIRGAFRYTNGNIYFITNSSVLEFNEFTGSVTRTVPDLFEVLGITCLRETMVNQLYSVIKYLK